MYTRCLLPALLLFQVAASAQAVGPAKSGSILRRFVAGTDDPQLVVSPAALSFQVAAGDPAPEPQQIGVDGPPETTFTVLAESDENWLTVDPGSAQTPAPVTVSVQPDGLDAGTYQGTITISAAGLAPVLVPVTLVVTSADAGDLAASPDTLAFHYEQGGASPPAQTVSLTSPGTASFTATAAAGWLSVSPASGSTPQTLTISVNPATLSAGSYQTAVTLVSAEASNSPFSIPVTLTVVPGAGGVSASPVALAFRAMQGGAAPDARTVSLSSAPPVSFSARASVDWLAVSPSAGVMPQALTLRANVAGMSPGYYQGAVTVTAPGASNSPLEIPVALQIISSAAPTYEFALRRLAGISSFLLMPEAVAVDVSGNVYFADARNIFLIDRATGVVTTLATGLSSPAGLALDGDGNLYFSENTANRIRKLAAGSRSLTTVAGTGAASFSGENTPAAAAQLNQPSGIALDLAGNIYFADTGNHRVRRIDAATGSITTVAGTGVAGAGADGAAATHAQLNLPFGVAFDPSGLLYITEIGNQMVRRLNLSTGLINRVAGTGIAGSSGDGGSALSAQLNVPTGVGVDGRGDVYLADAQNHTVRVLTTAGALRTVAGTGVTGSCCDGNARAASLNMPVGLAAGPAGSVFLTDFNANFVQRLSPLPAGAAPVISEVTASMTPSGSRATLFLSLEFADRQGDLQSTLNSGAKVLFEIGYPGGTCTDALSGDTVNHPSSLSGVIRGTVSFTWKQSYTGAAPIPVTVRLADAAGNTSNGVALSVPAWYSDCGPN